MSLHFLSISCYGRIDSSGALAGATTAGERTRQTERDIGSWSVSRDEERTDPPVECPPTQHAATSYNGDSPDGSSKATADAPRQDGIDSTSPFQSGDGAIGRKRSRRAVQKVAARGRVFLSELVLVKD